MTVYDFSVKASDGSMVNLKDYEGKVMLIVNTATGCGFTPQYEELQSIYSEMHEKGLEILQKIRLSKGLTQEALFFESSISRSHIAMIEAGQRDATISALFKISRWPFVIGSKLPG